MRAGVNAEIDGESAVERTTSILAAACRTIARTGARKLNLSDVAREAGVSKALIHYYFDSREDLVARAYEFADRRARERIRAEIVGPESAAIRLSRLLLMYFTEGAEVREDWILWSELSASAVFEPELRPTMEASFAMWTAWMEALIQEALDDGSLLANTDKSEAALRLTALVDGLGSQVVRGLITHVRAREILNIALRRELGMTEPDHPAVPATGYLRLLASLTKHAISELETLADTPAERDSIRRVADLIDRVAGGVALLAQDGADATGASVGRRRARRTGSA